MKLLLDQGLPHSAVSLLVRCWRSQVPLNPRSFVCGFRVSALLSSFD